MSLGKGKTAEIPHELCGWDVRKKSNYEVCEELKNIYQQMFSTSEQWEESIAERDLTSCLLGACPLVGGADGPGLGGREKYKCLKTP